MERKSHGIVASLLLPMYALPLQFQRESWYPKTSCKVVSLLEAEERVLWSYSTSSIQDQSDRVPEDKEGEKKNHQNVLQINKSTLI